MGVKLQVGEPLLVAGVLLIRVKMGQAVRTGWGGQAVHTWWAGQGSGFRVQTTHLPLNPEP